MQLSVALQAACVDLLLLLHIAFRESSAQLKLKDFDAGQRLQGPTSNATSFSGAENRKGAAARRNYIIKCCGKQSCINPSPRKRNNTTVTKAVTVATEAPRDCFSCPFEPCNDYYDEPESKNALDTAKSQKVCSEFGTHLMMVSNDPAHIEKKPIAYSMASARNLCCFYGMRLLAPKKADLLLCMAKAVKNLIGGSIKVWVSGLEPSCSGKYQWCSAGGEPFDKSQSLWAENEPKKSSGSCVALSVDAPNIGLSVENCNSNYSFVCEAMSEV